MSIARSILLWGSQSRFLARQASRRAFARRAVKRFMPGEDLDSALDAAARAASEYHLGGILTQLGENINSVADADAVRRHYLGVLDRIAERKLPCQISVKLTQLGLDVDAEFCLEAVGELAAHAATKGEAIWVDIEGSAYTDRTLSLFRRVRAEHPNVGLCLQAYLRRTPADLESLRPLAPAIRLVKGAYAEPPNVAYPKKQDVDAAYFDLAKQLLSLVKENHGAPPVFGTHDTALIQRIRDYAASAGLEPKGSYEIHMLYGIGTTTQRRLAAEGVPVRTLISYGEAWFPWYMRRLAERPANVWFVVKSLFR